MPGLAFLATTLAALPAQAGGAAAPAAGLAEKYPCDIGIERDPDVLFVESFESPNWMGKWQEVSGREYREIETDPALVYTGSHSLRLVFKPEAGKSAAGWMHYWWDGSEVVYLRYYFRLSTGGDWRNQKIMQLHGHKRGERYGTGAGNRPTGFDWFCSGTGVGGTKGPPWTRVILYTYHPHQKGGYGDNVELNQGIQPKISEEKWTCYEFMIKLNDLGKRNGEQRLWIDGRLVIEQTGLEWRKGAEMVTNNIMQPCYTHSPPAPGKERRMWLDGIVLARRYIGPVVKRAARKRKETGPSVWAIAAKKAREAREARSSKGAGGPLAPHAELIRAARERALRGEEEEAARGLEAVDGAPGELKAIAEGLRKTGELRLWIIKGAAKGRRETVFVNFLGRPARGKLVSADDEGLLVQVMGVDVPLKWADLGPKKLHALASKYAPQGPGASEALEMFAGTYGLSGK